MSTDDNFAVTKHKSDSDLKRMLLVILQSVVQQHAQGHDTAVKFAIFGSPVGVNENGGLIREDVSSFSPLALNLLLPFPFLLLTEVHFSSAVQHFTENQCEKKDIYRNCNLN